MPLSFPSNPAPGDIFLAAGRAWTWTGTVWQVKRLIGISDVTSLTEELDGIINLHPTRADFPATGRLRRLYLDDTDGTLWRWTGTTYSKIAPGDLDAGTY
jgi:hypothetical protein